MEVHDFLFVDGDLGIAQGDLAWGESTEQHQHDLLLATKGSIRQHPLAGVGIIRELLNSVSSADMELTIQREFEDDGMLVEGLRIKNGDVDITASYG